MELEPFDFNTPITKDITLMAKWDCPAEDHSVQDLLDALVAGDAESKFPVNTQIDDYTDGVYDPWLIGHYGTQYGKTDVTGVYLYRKYIYPVSMAWGDASNYGGSAIDTYLNTTYLNTCSDAIKNNVAQIDVPLVSGTTPAKIWLMSAAEVMGMSTGYAGGVEWDSWKLRTRLTQPSTDPNTGRIMAKGEIANGTGDPWRLRTEMNGSNGEASVTLDGAIRGITSSVEAGLVPACFLPVPSAGYDPNNPTMQGLVNALAVGDYDAFPVNTLIADTHNGNNINWVVAQYGETLTSNNMLKKGVYVFKDKALSQPQQFGTSNDYSQSPINTYLNSTYLEGCSDVFKSAVSEIPVQSSSTVTTNAKLWLMSGIEVLSEDPDSNVRDTNWDVWKLRTGLTSSSGGTNPGRIIKNEDETAVEWWLRTPTGNDEYLVSEHGAVGFNTVNLSRSVLPAAFIAANPEPIPGVTEPDFSQVLDQAQLANLSTIVKAGQARDYVPLGTELKISYGDYTMGFEVVGFNDVVVQENGEDKTVHAINLLANYALPTTTKWASTQTESYSESLIRQAVTGMESVLDSNFVNYLGKTKVCYYDISAAASAYVYDKIFAPSFAELNRNSSAAYYYSDEGPTYTLFEYNTNKAERIRHGLEAPSTGRSYWTRTIDRSNTVNKIYCQGSAGDLLTIFSINSAAYVVGACNFIG